MFVLNNKNIFRKKNIFPCSVTNLKQCFKSNNDNNMKKSCNKL